MYLLPNVLLTRVVTNLHTCLEKIGFHLKRIVLQGEQGFFFEKKYGFDVINKLR